MPTMDYDGSQRELVDVVKAARQVSSATGDGGEIAAFRRALGLTLPPLACGRPAATVKWTENEEGMPARRVAIGHSPPSTIRRPSRLSNRVAFGLAHVFGVLPGGVFRFPDSSEVTK
jgi:hypothetical protein